MLVLCINPYVLATIDYYIPLGEWLIFGEILGIIISLSECKKRCLMSQRYVIGNWKTNPATCQEAMDLAQQLSVGNGCIVGCAPSFVHLAGVASKIDSKIWLGVQDISACTATTGAFTGDVSVSQVADLGVGFVLIGHSERRYYHHETEAVLSKKLSHAFTHGLSAIYCIGETKEEYERGNTFEILKNQLAILQNFTNQINVADGVRLIVAYEPVWAIGTGLTPTFDEIEAVHRFIKDELKGFGVGIAVLYGGSVNENNAATLASSSLIDGVLVGGASLKVQSFAKISEAFSCTASKN